MQDIDPNRKPDAVLFPVGWEPASTTAVGGRGDRLCRYLEGIMGASPNQKAYYRDISATTVLGTLGVYDSLLYPNGHRLAGQPRYDWTQQTQGIQYGYLKADPTGGAA